MVATQDEHRNFEREDRKGISFALALLVHAALGVFLLISVQWRTQRVQTVEVEMWSSPPPAQEQIPVVQPQPQPPAPREVKVVEPERPPEPAPEIVEEKIKPVIKPPVIKPVEKPVEKPIEPPKPEKKPKPAEKGVDALSTLLNQGVEARNKAATPNAKAAGKISGEGTNPLSTRTTGKAAMDSAGGKPTDGYMDLVVRLIKSNLSYPEIKRDYPKAKIRVSLLPDGTIQNVQVVKVVGDPAYAEATRLAVRTTQRFPPQPDGKLFSGDSREWVLNFCYDKNIVTCKID